MEIIIDFIKDFKDKYPQTMRYLYISIGGYIVYFLLMINMSFDSNKIHYTNLEDIVYTDENSITHVSKSSKELWVGKATKVIIDKKKYNVIILFEDKNGKEKKNIYHFESMEPINQNAVLMKQISKYSN
jgi:hypothetical protein